MITSNILLSREAIQSCVSNCASWINSLKLANLVVCPVMQSGVYFSVDVLRSLPETVKVDFAGVLRYDGDNMHMYKAPDFELVKNANVVVIDVLASTGKSIDNLSKIINQIGANKVYKAVLLKRQFCTIHIDWVGKVISDEDVYGYGLDIDSQHRNINAIYYE